MGVDRGRFDQSDHHQGRDASHRALRGEADEQPMRAPEPTAFETDGPPLETMIDEDRLESLRIDDSHHGSDNTPTPPSFQ